MTLVFSEDGMQELTASGGVTAFTSRQTREAFELLDLVRARGGGSPELVAAWCMERPRALLPIVADRLRHHGFDIRREDPIWHGFNGNVPSAFKAAAPTVEGLSDEEVAELETLAKHAHGEQEHPRRPYKSKDGSAGSRAPWDRPSPSQREQGDALLGQ